MTYSLEQCAIRAVTLAAVGVQAVIDFARRAEQLTRPAQRGAGGEDGEAVGWASVLTPELQPDYMRVPISFCPDEVPNPTEPGLDNDELVAVRQLIEERFNPDVPAVGGVITGHSDKIPVELSPGCVIPHSKLASLSGQVNLDALNTYKSSAWSAGRAEPNPSPDPRPGGDGPAEASGHSPDPSSAGHSHAAMAIYKVLEKHQWTWHVGRIECWDNTDGVTSCGWFEDNEEWRWHVSGLIAEALAAQPK